MTVKIKWTISLWAILVSPCVQAQFGLGGNPSELKWQILSSPSVRVIYPQGMNAQAQRIAGLINHMDSTNRRSVGPLKKRLDLVLQNQSVVSNGYVALAPFRSEFYSTPPAGNLALGSPDWLDLLAIHEYRHALQFMNTKRGLGKLFYWLQGETLWGSLAGLTLPSWYFEGDAVIAETALSEGGRGRMPFFSMEQRALALANKNYAYSKHRNDSYRDLIPNAYPLGYMMLTQVRNEFGNDVIGQVLKNNFWRLVYPFSQSMKKYTGLSTTDLYQHAWEVKKTAFARQLDSLQLNATEMVTAKAKRVVTNYRFPIVLDNGDIISLKNSYQSTDGIVRISKGKEKLLTRVGYHVDTYLQHSDGLLTWTEMSRDLRWDNRNFNDILLYDLKSGKKRRLTHHSKYFSPSISPQGGQIAAIHITPEQVNEIHILDSKTAEVKQKLTTPSNFFLSRTAWLADGSGIVTIAKNKGRLALVQISLQDGSIRELTPWTSHIMETPLVKGDRVYFNASFTGIDNIFYTDLNGTKEIFQVSSVPIGAFEPQPTPEKDIVFTEFTEMGYGISRQKLSAMPLGDKPIQILEPKAMQQFRASANEVEGGNILNLPIRTDFASKSYQGPFRGMKLYSWQVSPSRSTPGLHTSMVNILRDVSLEIGGTVNLNEGKAFGYDAQLIYARFFPVIALKANQSAREIKFYGNDQTIQVRNFKEINLGTEVRVPLSWIQGNMSTYLTPSIGMNYRQFKGIQDTPDRSNHFSDVQLGLNLGTLRRTAYQNLGSRLGMQLAVYYFKPLGSAGAEKFQGVSKFYFPGIGRNHNLVMSAAYQKEGNPLLYQYADNFEYPRGFATPIHTSFRQFSADYNMPLVYPDFGVKGIVHLKRIRLNLFYDYGQGAKNALFGRRDYNAVGAECILETNLLNVLPFQFGFRQSYLLTQDPANPERKTQFSVHTAFTL